MKARSLADLKALRDELARRQREAAEQVAREAARRAALERERRLFETHVGQITPLQVPPRAPRTVSPPDPLPRQREADEREALREALSDEVDVESLLLTDDGLSFRRPGISAEVVTKLRKGHWAIQGQVDLHGQRRDEAREVVARFVRESHRHGLRCLRVIHGKGHGSPGREPVLKSRVQRWLAQRAEVIAFAQASGPQGGAGALIVLLAPSSGPAGAPPAAEPRG